MNPITPTLLGIPKGPRGIIYNFLPAADLFSLNQICTKVSEEVSKFMRTESGRQKDDRFWRELFEVHNRARKIDPNNHTMTRARTRDKRRLRFLINFHTYHALDKGNEDQAIALLQALPDKKEAWITNGEKYTLFPGWLYNSIKTASVKGYPRFLDALFNHWLPEHGNLIDITEKEINYFKWKAEDSKNAACADLLQQLYQPASDGREPLFKRTKRDA